MNLTGHARREVERRAYALLDRELPGLDRVRHRVLGALLARTAAGWHLFVRRDMARPDAARADGARPDEVRPDGMRADAFLLGGNGVYAVSVAERGPGEAAAQAIRRHAEERFAGIRGARGQVLARSALHFVVLVPGSAADGPDGGRLYWTLTEPELERLFAREARHLDRRQVAAIAAQAAGRLSGYAALRVEAPEREPEPAGLLDAAELTEDQLVTAQQRPFDSWLTFLHPHQNDVVTRNYNGPARISGPAGTGKTVVALHRLRHLAHHSTGPLLFTTFVRTLPLVHQLAFRRLAPESVERTEFTNLHAWARNFLARRGKTLNVHNGQIDTAFSRAWTRHRESLRDIESAPQYWRDEIDRVIKGRGVRSFADYAGMRRAGRNHQLNAAQRSHVWELFQSYQEILADKGVHDHQDLISVALDELRERPPGTRYAAVVVDEVQDITLTGLRMLNELAGTGANRLLLVGDGQQQVYSGGWRLSDAGISIQGRGEVLRVNYRNRSGVLDFAQTFDATNQVDDLDGGAGVALRDVESANSGGRTRLWRGSAERLATDLPAAVRELPVPVGNTALIVFGHADLESGKKILRAAGIEYTDLANYQGEETETLKVGTVHRAKGLDFQGVLVIEFAHPGAPEDPEARQLRGRQQLVAATRARDYLWWGTVESG